MTARAYIVRDQKTALFWSPKSGCTSLVQWLVFGYLGMGRKQLEQSGVHDARQYLKQNGFLPDEDELLDLVANQGFEAIVLVRNPALRILSAYVNKFVQYAGKWLTKYEELEEIAQKQLVNWGAGFAQDGSYIGISFNEFLAHIELSIRDCGGTDATLDPHWGFQVSQEFLDKGLTYDKILCLEDFGNAVAWLNERFGVFYGEPVTNRTKYSEGQTLDDIGNQPSVVLAETQAKLDKAQFLTPPVMETIGRIYARDYETFDYDRKDYEKIPEKVVNQGQAVKDRQKLYGQAYLDHGGRDLPYEVHDNGFDKTVVAFGGLGLELGMPVFEFRKALAQVDVNWVFFKDVYRSWYHAPNGGFGQTFRNKTENLPKILGRLAATEIYTLGSSAGGFAALMFAPFIKAKASLLFGPQVFIDQRSRNMLKDHRWPRLIGRIEAEEFLSVKDIADSGHKFPVHIIIGNNDRHDILHALYASRYVDARISVLGQGGHNPARELKNAGILDDVLSDFLAGRGIQEYGNLHIGQRRAALRTLEL